MAGVKGDDGALSPGAHSLVQKHSSTQTLDVRTPIEEINIGVTSEPNTMFKKGAPNDRRIPFNILRKMAMVIFFA